MSWDKETSRPPQGLEGIHHTATAPDGSNVHFLRLPSIAQHKHGPDYVTPMRLDPRLLERMQRTIESLEHRYVGALELQMRELFSLLDAATSGDAEALARLYEVAHDVRGVAGTFGRIATGRFANSLCNYIEACGPETKIERMVVRFHLEAMHDAALNPDREPALAAETLKNLEQLATSVLHRNRGTA